MRHLLLMSAAVCAALFLFMTGCAGTKAPDPRDLLDKCRQATLNVKNLKVETEHRRTSRLKKGRKVISRRTGTATFWFRSASTIRAEVEKEDNPGAFAKTLVRDNIAYTYDPAYEKSRGYLGFNIYEHDLTWLKSPFVFFREENFGREKLKLAGRGNINGRAAWIIEIDHNNDVDPPTEYYTRLWIDRESYLPLKRLTRMPEVDPRELLTDDEATITTLKSETFPDTIFDPDKLGEGDTRDLFVQAVTGFGSGHEGDWTGFKKAAKRFKFPLAVPAVPGQGEWFLNLEGNLNSGEDVARIMYNAAEGDIGNGISFLESRGPLPPARLDMYKREVLGEKYSSIHIGETYIYYGPEGHSEAWGKRVVSSMHLLK